MVLFLGLCVFHGVTPIGVMPTVAVGAWLALDLEFPVRSFLIDPFVDKIRLNVDFICIFADKFVTLYYI